MKKKLVIMIGFLPNPRIYKRIALEKKSFEVHLICWDRGTDMQAYPQEDGYQVHCIAIPAGSDPVKRLVPYQKFSDTAQKMLTKIKPDIIHVQGLDMLKIACKAKHTSTKPIHIVYEVSDLHRLLVDKQENPANRLAQVYLKREDRRCCKMIDLLIVTSPGYIETYFHEFVPKDKIFVFPNVPDLSAFQNFQKKQRGANFTVGFLGDIRYPRQMKNLLEAVEACGMRVLFAGFEQGGHEIEELCRAYPKGEWFGRFDFKTQAAELYGRCDAIYSVYDADMANVRAALPNKLYEAVYCELPLIVAKETYLAQIVEEWDVGVAVDHRNPGELIGVLKELRDNTERYSQFCLNCRKHRSEINLQAYNEKLLKRLLQIMNEVS